MLDRPEASADPALFGAALVTVAGFAPLVDIGPARQYGHQAAELARQLGDDRLLAEAIACTERSGDQLLRSFLHNNAAVQALRTGDVPAARAHLDQAAQAAQAIGQENPAVAANLGWVQREEGNPDAARSSFEATLRIGRRSGEQPVIACALLGLGCLAADLGDWDRSAVLHGVAQAFLDRSGEPWQDLEARYRQRNLAQVRAHLGDDLFDRAYAQGLALSPDEVLPAALANPGAGISDAAPTRGTGR